MKNLKRVLALVIALVLVMGTAAFAAETTESTYDIKYEEAADLLNQLGIMVGYADGEFHAEETLTKEQGARIAYALLGYLKGTLNVAETGFSDVTPDADGYWASGYINYLNGYVVNDGTVISGQGDGTFGLGKNLSYDEYNVILTTILGYAPYAKENNGYPRGFKKAAEFAGLYEGEYGTITYDGANAITRGEVAVMTANAIVAPTMQRVYYGDTATYTPTNVPYYAAELNLVRATGTVSKDDTKYTVEDTTLAAGETDIADAVGLEVTAYGNSTTWLAVVGAAEKASVASSTDKAKFEIAVGTTTTVTADKTASSPVLYTCTNTTYTVNGVVMTDAAAANTAIAALNTANFKATIYGDAKNKIATEVVIEAYSIGKVTSAAAATNTLIVNAETSTTNTTWVSTIGDKKSTLTGIALADAKDTFVKVVPSVAKDGTVSTSVAAYTAITETVAGAIVGSNKDGYEINGTYYKLNTNFFVAGDIKMGTAGTYTLDLNGKIVAFKADSTAAVSTTTKLGYITYIEETDNRGTIGLTLDIIIDGTKVQYDYTDTSSTTEMYDTIADLSLDTPADATALSTANVVLVKIDADNNITAIEKAITEALVSGAKYDATYNKLGDIYMDDVAIYSGAATGSSVGTFTKQEASYLKNGTTYDLYKIKDAVIIVDSAAAADNTIYYAMVNGAYVQKYESGKTYTYLDVIVGGEAATLKALVDAEATPNNGDVLKGMSKGQYISYKLNADGLATDITKVAEITTSTIAYDADTYSIELKASPVATDKTTSGYAVITSVDGVQVGILNDGTLKATDAYDAEADNTVIDILGKTPVYVYNVTDGTITVSTVADVLAASIITVDGEDKVVAAVYNAMYVRVNGKSGADAEIVEIVYYTNLKDNVTA